MDGILSFECLRKWNENYKSASFRQLEDRYLYFASAYKGKAAEQSAETKVDEPCSMARSNEMGYQCECKLIGT